jgi:hypothetical protein
MRFDDLVSENTNPVPGRVVGQLPHETQEKQARSAERRSVSPAIVRHDGATAARACSELVQRGGQPFSMRGAATNGV